MTRPLACHCGNSRHRGTTNHGERWVCDDCHCLYATPEAEFPLDYGREPECRALEERWQREHGACGACGAPLDELGGDMVCGNPECPVCVQGTATPQQYCSTCGTPITTTREGVGYLSEGGLCLDCYVKATPNPVCVECGEPGLELSKMVGGGIWPDRRLRCFDAECDRGRQNRVALGEGSLVLVSEPLVYGAVYAGQTVATGTPVPAAQTSRGRQHFSGLDPEEGEKMQNEGQQSSLTLDDSLVAKVGLETPTDAPPQEGRKPRGRPKKDKPSESLQDGQCRDGVNGPAGQRSAGPRQSSGGVPDLKLAMGAMVAVSHMAAAIGQLEATRSGDAELPLPLRLWFARVLYHMGEAASWLGVVRAFASGWPAPIGELTHVTLVLPAEEKVPAKLEAVCGRYICVSAEVDAIFAVCPRWVGWFDGKTGRWLADGQEPEAWSDRITLERSSLPAEIRAEVDRS